MSTTVHGPDGATPPAAAPPAEPPTPDPAPELPPAAETPAPVEPPPAVRPDADEKLFDAKPFERLKPNVDDEDTDAAKVAITGGYEIDLENAADVAWFNRLFRGQSVTLQIEAEVTDRIAPMKRNKKTDETTVTGVVKLKVTHVYRPAPEELT